MFLVIKRVYQGGKQLSKMSNGGHHVSTCCGTNRFEDRLATHGAFLSWLEVPHHSTQAGDDRAICSDVLNKVAVCLCDHDVLV